MTRLCLLAIAALSCGCTQLALFTVSKESLQEASSKNPVVEVMCLWEPAEGKGLEGLPARGFAGQVLFFTPGHPQPVKVDGDIMIYVFDDQGTADEQARPIHQFAFDSDCWNTFLRKSNIGASYQMFIPYTRSGAYYANCSLRVRFTPKDGGAPVYSRMAPVPLPGRRRETAAIQQQPEGNSVPSPVGEPARAESASGMDLPPAVSAHFRKQLSQLQTAAATASRQIDAPQRLPALVAQDALPIEDDDSPAPERRSYRLTPQ